MPPPNTHTLRTLRVERSRQNSNLAEIKGLMAAEAKAVGSNAILAFKYGQRAHTWREQLLSFKWDSESWYGEGLAVHLSDE